MTVPPAIRGGIQMMVPPDPGTVLAARMELSANYTVPGTPSTVPFDTVIFDDLGVTGHRANSFVIQSDGRYEIESHVEVGVGTLAIVCVATIYMNNTIDIDLEKIAFAPGSTPDGAWFKLSSGINDYTAGDFFEITILSDAGEDVDGGAGTPYNYFTIKKYG